VIQNEGGQSHSVSAASEGPETDTSDGQLVVVHPSVFATLDHAFGNLFQRVYHLIRTVRSGNDQTIAALDESVHELQSLLELFVDYVAPTSIHSRPVRAADLIGSFRRHLEAEIGASRVSIAADEPADPTWVPADPARMARAFQLLSQALAGSVGVGQLGGRAGLSSDQAHLELSCTLSARRGSAADELRWVLAQKLVDLQGGELSEGVGPCGRQWTLRLPLATS